MTPTPTPFVLKELAQGWAVTWPDYEIVVANTARKIQTLVDLLLRDFHQDSVRFDVVRVGMDLPSTTLTIGVKEWQRPGDHCQYLAEHLARTYLIRGVQFHDQESARGFRAHMEQRLMWRRLGGQWG
jgi:hypothetical protein